MEAIYNGVLSRTTRAWVRMALTCGLISGSAAGMAADTDTAPLAVPPPPTHVIGFPTITGDLAAAVVLSWRRSFGATSYEVFMGTSPGGESSTPVATVIGPRVEIKELAGLTPYYFTVKAHNLSGDSAPSAEIKVTTGCDINCE